MYFNRGSPFDYDNWADLTGDTSWRYENMLKYFKRLEDCRGGFPLGNQHGRGGPITISRPSYSPGLREWLGAGRSLGYPVADPNGPQQVSFTPAEMSQKFGRRVSSFTGYIKPYLATRRNLKAIVNAHLTKILFENTRTNLKAIGVIYTTAEENGSTVIVKARKEIILSAGVLGSPAILLRSGIGSKKFLENAGISSVKHLPVGENLHDHVTVPISVLLNTTSQIFDPIRDLTTEALEMYNRIGDGPYASLDGAHSQAFVPSSQSTNPYWPNLQLIHFMTNKLPGAYQSGQESVGNVNETPVFCLAFLTRPKSRGSVTLNVTNVQGDPVVDFQYLEDPSDMTALIEGINMTIEIFERAPVYQKLGARYPPNPIAGCGHLQFRSDEHWRCYIGQRGDGGLHGAGSCRMGKGPEAVVDTRLKVIGIENLRVVDASIMPQVVNTNTQAAVYAIAEKASDMILNEWVN